MVLALAYQCTVAQESPKAAPKQYTLRCVMFSVKSLPGGAATAEQALPVKGMTEGTTLPLNVRDLGGFVTFVKGLFPKAELTVVVSGALTLKEGETTEAEFAASQPWDRRSLRVQGSLVKDAPPEVVAEYHFGTADRPISSSRVAALANGHFAFLQTTTGRSAAELEGTMLVTVVTPGGLSEAAASK
jgi:hypothetical protein